MKESDSNTVRSGRIVDTVYVSDDAVQGRSADFADVLCFLLKCKQEGTIP